MEVVFVNEVGLPRTGAGSSSVLRTCRAWPTSAHGNWTWTAAARTGAMSCAGSLTGRSAMPRPGMSSSPTCIPRIGCRLEQLFDESQTETATRPTRYRIRRPSGEFRHIQARRHCDFSPDGTVRRMYGTVQDITDVQRAEDERREAQELFETAFSQAPIGMALVGLDGRWLRVNAAVTRITGWVPEELLDRHVPGHHPP